METSGASEAAAGSDSSQELPEGVASRGGGAAPRKRGDAEGEVLEALGYDRRASSEVHLFFFFFL